MSTKSTKGITAFSSYWYLHLGLAFVGTVCGAYALVSLFPFWLSLLVSGLLVAGIVTLKEYRWDSAPCVWDMVWSGLGIALGLWLAIAIYGTILPGSYGIPWVALFGLGWLALNVAGLVPPLKKHTNV